MHCRLLLLTLLVALAILAAPARAAGTATTAVAITAAVERATPPSAPATVPAGRGSARSRADVRAFYAARNHAPAWHDDNGATPAAIAVLRALRTADNKGLDARHYDGTALTYRLLDLPLRGPPDDRWADWDVALSLALARYLQDLHFGRIDPAAVGHGLRVDPARIDLAAVLAGIATGVDVDAKIAAVEPAFRHYRLLEQQLVRYRELAAIPGLTSLPPLPKRTVEPGEDYAGAVALARLLAALGDLPDADAVTDGRFDTNLSTAVQRFQRRHGLEADGRLGRGTFVALTTPLRRRVQQIELTLERWRWLPPRLESPPIIVNIPAFRLYAFTTTDDDESHMLRMNVIVGQAFREQHTPVFAANMTHLIFDPYWDVPRSIALKELLPDIRRHPGYMEKNHFELVAGQSDDSPVLAPTAANLALVAAGRARLRQRPGDDNALGRVKFMLPNSYNVYLHDTPAKSLFARARRAFSHGCVRLGDPVGLAEHVLRGSPEWTHERILEAMKGDAPERVYLPAPVRVFFVYGTALASDTQVFFFEDVYGHDETLARALRASR
ncbi:MAG: L,D-transpeptidase family protein [Steroidobacteraceae bacterium]